MNEGQQISSKFVGTLLILLVFLVLPALINIPRGYANLTPYSITSSVLYNNPGSGVESSISVDPNNSSYLIDSFVGQPLAGTVPYSLDGGATWHNSTQATGWCSIPGS